MNPIIYPSQVLASNADIILAIHHLRSQMSTATIIEWMRGHQDEGSSKRKEDHIPKVQTNIELDDRAKHSRVYDIEHQPTPYTGSGAMLMNDGVWITSNYADQIQEAIMKPKHLKFFLKKYKTKTVSDYRSIFWKEIGWARKKLSEAENIRLTKYLNGWLNTGRQKGHFGTKSDCPCCGWHEEDQLHILQCAHPEMTKSRTTAFAQCEKVLSST